MGDEAALAQTFRAQLSRCRFPPAGTAIDCAVSGGADSSALMILGVAAGCEITAFHVDHGLREGSVAEAALVASLAQRLGANFIARQVEVLPGPNLEARARSARYGVLPPGVMTGHTADDQAETMLLNLLRGAGLNGMAAMARSDRRPILGLRRSDTEAVCAAFGHEWLNDPMNADGRFRRVRVRSELVPLLNDLGDRDVTPVLARQAELFADDAAALDALARELDAHDARALASAHPAVGRRAVRRLLRDGPCAQHPPDLATVERVLAVASGEAVGADVGSGWRVQRTNQRLRLIAPD